MAYTNSNLISYKKISPNRTVNRNHKIDTITIHCVAGQCSVETLGSIFAKSSRKASSNYGIGPDGRIGMYVEEKDRSWCTSSSANDNRAVTIEVASDTTSPYAVKFAAYSALIRLVADICKRNNIKELKWKGDKSLIGQISKQNMTVHRWFANTDCPGDYLFKRQGEIANKVNVLLGVKTTETVAPIEVNKGDIVYLIPKATYTSGANVPNWVIQTPLYVREINGDLITISTKISGAITGIVNKNQIKSVKSFTETKTFTTYKVSITADALNIRKGPGTSYDIAGVITDKTGIYTIVDESNGWGKLKSGAGWISLKYTKKVQKEEKL